MGRWMSGWGGGGTWMCVRQPSSASHANVEDIREVHHIRGAP